MTERRHGRQPRVIIDLGGRARVACVVAATPLEQARGLQGFAPLHEGEGMLFPFIPAKHARFHMGSVGFPIDIVFFNETGRAGQIVTAAPGSKDRWDFMYCSAVVELPGGFCQRVGFSAGDPGKFIYDEPKPEQRELADDPNPVMPEERYKDRQDVSESSPDAMSGSSPHFKEQYGFSALEEEEYGLRPMARRAQLIGDPGSFVAGMVEAMMREGGVPWRPEVLTAGTLESAVITRDDIERWIGNLNVAGQHTVVAAAASPQGLQALGDGLILAGVADISRVVGPNRDALVVWRTSPDVR